MKGGRERGRVSGRADGRREGRTDGGRARGGNGRREGGREGGRRTPACFAFFSFSDAIALRATLRLACPQDILNQDVSQRLIADLHKCVNKRLVQATVRTSSRPLAVCTLPRALRHFRGCLTEKIDSDRGFTDSGWRCRVGPTRRIGVSLAGLYIRGNIFEGIYASVQTRIYTHEAHRGLSGGASRALFTARGHGVLSRLLDARGLTGVCVCVCVYVYVCVCVCVHGRAQVSVGVGAGAGAGGCAGALVCVP